MANVQASLIELMLTKSAITTLVGTRIEPEVPLQGSVYPFIVVQVSGKTRTHAITGVTRNAEARFEIACCAETVSGAAAVADAIRGSEIMTYRGVTSGIWFQSFQWEHEMNDKDQPIDGSDKWRFFTVFDLVINYTEAA